MLCMYSIELKALSSCRSITKYLHHWTYDQLFLANIREVPTKTFHEHFNLGDSIAKNVDDVGNIPDV